MTKIFTILLSAALFASACICQADDYAYVDFSYAGLEYSTNFVAYLTPGDDFIYEGPLSEVGYINNLVIGRHPEQFDNKCVLLTVGINFYVPESQLAYLPCCVNDADMIRNKLESYYEVSYLSNENATKDNIRSEIQKAASELAPGDTFFYYHSGWSIGQDLCAYDTVYKEDELMYDLGSFQKGVNVIMVRDLNTLDGIPLRKSKEIAPDNLDDILIITADKMITKKKHKDALSPFTAGLIWSVEPTTDKDGNCILSFSEIFERASVFYKEKLPKGSCTLENDILSETLVFAVLPDETTDGVITEDRENLKFTLKVRNVSDNVIIGLTEDYYNSPLEINKGTYKLSIKEDKQGNKLYSEKLDLSFDIRAKNFTFFSENVVLFLNGFAIPCSYLQKETKSGTTFAVLDYNFNQIGKLQVKPKNSVYSCRFTYSQKNQPDYSRIFSTEGDFEYLNFAYRDYFCLMPTWVEFHKQYKEGKSLNAKMFNPGK